MSTKYNTNSHSNNNSDTVVNEIIKREKTNTNFSQKGEWVLPATLWA